MKLYIDFDGVILNTIEVSYQRIKEKYGPGATAEDSAQFYQSIDWNKFIYECSPINNSLIALKHILDSQKYEVAILTHVHSKHEQEAKKKYLQDVLPEIKYIPVTKPTPKWKAVDCKDSILVDDYSKNLKEWEEHGGIAIKFSTKNKEYQYLTIKNLETLLTDYETIIKRKKTKTLKK